MGLRNPPNSYTFSDWFLSHHNVSKWGLGKSSSMRTNIDKLSICIRSMSQDKGPLAFDPWHLPSGKQRNPSPRHRKSQQCQRLQRSRVRNSVFHLILPCPHSHQPFKKIVLPCSSDGCPGVCSEFMQHWHMAFFLQSLYINYSEMYFMSRLIHQH